MPVDEIRDFQPLAEFLTAELAGDGIDAVKVVIAADMAETDFNDLAKTALKPLRSLHVTPYVPYHVVTHRSGLEGPLVERIKAVLKSTDETEFGRKALMGFERTTKFDNIPPELLANVLKLEPFLHLIITPKE